MRLGAIVIDGGNIEELADFYASWLGWIKNSEEHDGEKWITVIKSDYSETPLVFQENLDYVKPEWPPNTNQQQHMIHLDFYVRAMEFESIVKKALDCGAHLADEQFSADWQVMIDPAGHPFCVIPIADAVYQERYGINGEV